MSGDGSEPFNIKDVQVEVPLTFAEEAAAGSSSRATASAPTMSAAMRKKKDAQSRIEKYIKAIREIPALNQYGSIFKSSIAPQMLTEQETEYKVRVLKHTYKQHIILQFEILNTLEDILLENIQVELEPADGFSAVAAIPAKQAKYNEPALAYTVLEFDEDDEDLDLSGEVAATLKFDVKDIDPNDPDEDTDAIEAYEDEYELEAVELEVADHVQQIIKPNFQISWDEMDTTAVEKSEQFVLSTMNTLEQAVKDLQKFLGLYAQEKTDRIPEGQGSHTLLLAGVFRGGHDVLAKADWFCRRMVLR